MGDASTLPVPLFFARNYCPVGGTAETGMSWLLSSCGSPVWSWESSLHNTSSHHTMVCTLSPTGAKWPVKPQQLRRERECDQHTAAERQKHVVNKSPNSFELRWQIWAVLCCFVFFFFSLRQCVHAHIFREITHILECNKNENYIPVKIIMAGGCYRIIIFSSSTVTVLSVL